MDPPNSQGSKTDEETALKSLFDVFSSVCSLEEIASAYLRAGGDVNTAGEMLSQRQGTTPTDGFQSCDDITISDIHSVQSQLENVVKEPNYLYQGSPILKPEKLTASTGIVSAVLGKGYYLSTSSQSERSRPSKPLKIVLKEPVVDDAAWKTVSSASTTENAPAENQDTIEFLFSMLGDGFKLDKNVIKDVLGSCGFDAKKTMERLLASASSDLDKGKEIHPDAQEFKGSTQTLGPQLSERELKPSSAERKSTKSRSSHKKKTVLQREILESLFCAPKISEEVPKRTRFPIGLNRTRIVGQKSVCAPLDDVEPTPSIKLAKEVVKDEDEEDGYLIHRRTAKQNWEMMREYYEAAVDAFTKGDRGKADYLQEQGNFYLKMAQKADEKSSGLILGMGRSQDDFVLNLHGHHAKEAVKLLKFHLESLAGIPSYQCLKVLVDADGGDITKGKRRKMVLQLLEKESIQWTEDAGTICIQVSTIDPRKLSFVGDSQIDKNS